MNEINMAYVDLARAREALTDAEEKLAPLRREYERVLKRVQRLIAEDVARRRAS